MKKILVSLLAVGVVVGAGFAVTRAYFTDTETSEGNTFEAGTIDIGVDGMNPWKESFKLEDMKPSQTDYINFTVNNFGTNPVNVLKRLVINENGADGLVSEPECVEGGGTWDENSDPKCGKDYVSKDDIETAILYDLIVEVYDATGKKQWWQTLYDGMHVEHDMLADVALKDMFMGMLPVGWSMKVRQSYHMDPETTNWAQGDVMNFDIVLTGEQLKGELAFQNKYKPAAESPDVVIDFVDDIEGLLTYKVKDSTFKYDFTGKVTKASTQYSLIHYVDPWPGNGVGTWPGTDPSLGELAKATSDGTGAITFSGDKELNSSLVSAKLWLVPSASYNPGTMKMVAFPEKDILFETGLMDYYDADL